MKLIFAIILSIMCLSSIVGAQANISIIYTPAFDTLMREPRLIVTYENTGNEPIYNLTSSMNTSGLDLSKNSFFFSNNTFEPYIASGESKYFSMQFKFPDTRDDITVRTVTGWEQNGSENSIRTGFTVPAGLIILASGASNSIVPVVGLIVTAILILYYKKRKEGS